MGAVGAGDSGGEFKRGRREGSLVIIGVGEDEGATVDGGEVGFEEGGEEGTAVGKRVGGRGVPSAQQNTPAF